jgi:hypothetical protein
MVIEDSRFHARSPFRVFAATLAGARLPQNVPRTFASATHVCFRHAGAMRYDVLELRTGIFPVTRFISSVYIG